MAPKKRTIIKRSASDASLDTLPSEKRFQASDPVEETPKTPGMGLRSSTNARRELDLPLKTPTKRHVPCTPCLEALISWEPGDGEPAFCFEGEWEDTCARCGEIGDECTKPSGFLSGHAYILHSKLHIGAGADTIGQEQKAIREYLRQSNPPQLEGTSRAASIKGFRHGVESVLAVIASDEALAPKLSSFRQAAESMVSLLSDENEQTEVPRKKSLCSGAETAMALAKNEENKFDMGGFRKGAEAVTSLLSAGGRQHRVQLDGFCQGADTMAGLIGGCDDGRSSWNPAGAWDKPW